VLSSLRVGLVVYIGWGFVVEWQHVLCSVTFTILYVGNMSGTKKSMKAVLSAIEGTHGIKADIADKLGVTRPTLDSYIEKWATVKAAYEEEKSRIDDVARSVVVDDILINRDVSTAKWWLTKKDPEFSERLDLTSGGEKIVVRITDD
jgi:hypothetical protein